eukprot:CAMPEP_0170606644 /NCGR_PEP_ID=MMETSP0224-20130122/20624_1 /TAXON_ID=285029 /ORGANISM="Togula jolla, Strain CCCM 725" /LENGTH=424 /DNA_ID=CAMNT_0010931743 /DNA_START=41 /DNA_END=1312 /DNA_ORIENTATION=-
MAEPNITCRNHGALSTRRAETSIVYRDYCASDDVGCKALEETAAQGGRFPALQRLQDALLGVVFEHYVTFDAKAKQYDESVMRVATHNDRMVGVGCGVLKVAKYHGKACKVAYIFDLRVDQDYQGLGIGGEITSQVESECERQGAKYLYLSVNADNTKARAMYARRGFVLASHRWPALAFLYRPFPEDDTIKVSRVTTEKALELTSRAYEDSDLTLASMDAVFRSSLYEGTFVARRGDSFAGVSLWNASFLTGVACIRLLLLPIQFWRFWPVQAVVLFLIGMTLLAWTLQLHAAFRLAQEDGGALHWLWFFFLSAATVAALFLAKRGGPIARFVMKKVLYSDGKLRHRIFGPFAAGPIEEQKQLMRAVLAKAFNSARDQGYAMSVCNMDKDYALRECFPPAQFSTIFMQKRVKADSAGEPLPQW